MKNIAEFSETLMKRGNFSYRQVLELYKIAQRLHHCRWIGAAMGAGLGTVGASGGPAGAAAGVLVGYLTGNRACEVIDNKVNKFLHSLADKEVELDWES